VSAHGRRWLVLVAIVLLTLNLRTAVTALSPLMPRVVAAIDLSGTQVGLLGSLPPFCFAVSALAGPPLLRRLPAERLVVLSLTLAAAGQLARPWAPSAASFLALSVLALLGMGLGNVVLPVLVKTYFPHRIGKITAVYVIGLVAGTTFPPLVVVSMADRFPGPDSHPTGWQLALAFWGATAALTLLPWIAPALAPRAVPDPQGQVPEPRALDRTAEPARPIPATLAPEPHVPILRSPTAWGVMLLFGVNSMISYSLFAWLPVRLVEAGLPESAGGTAIAMFAVVGAPGALIVPVLVTRIRHEFPLVMFLAASFGTGLTGMLLSPGHGILVWTFLAGVGGSGFPLSLTLIGLRTRSPVMAGRLSGFAQGVGYLGAGTGPLAVGALYESTGEWNLPFAFLVSALALFILGGWLVRHRRAVEDDLDLPTRGEVRAGPTSPDTLGR
jgi:CP family cyanate transporter-like MFS transporter